jgi:hypothetical protein
MPHVTEIYYIISTKAIVFFCVCRITLNIKDCLYRVMRNIAVKA